MKTLITAAIREGRLLRLHYDGRTRIVEPHSLGITESNQEAVLCWQVTPPVRDGQAWRLFRFDGIFGLQLLGDRVEPPPAGRQPPPEMFSVTDAFP